MPSFTPIDLSKLPLPSAIMALDYESIIAEMKAPVLAAFPDLQIGEADVLMKAWEIGAYYLINKIAAFNNITRNYYLATATGDNLDNIAAGRWIVRKTGETDDELRQRVAIAPNAYSVAGPSGAYYFHALSAHDDVFEVGVSSPSAGVVQIVVLAKNGVPTADVLTAVTTALNSESIRPITDQVVVLPVQMVDYQINATIYTNDGADPQLVLDYAKTNLDTYLSAARKVGVDIAQSGIFASLHVAGVQKVVLASPVGDIAINELQCGNCTAININYGGTNG